MQIMCELAGAAFRPAEAKAELRAAVVGTTVSLEPDPENEYDPSAVKVMLNGHHIGFVARGSNPPVFSALVDGDEVFAEIVSFAAPLKPVLEITL